MNAASVRLPILYYHQVREGIHPSKGVQPRAFNAQMRLLRRLGYRSVAFEDLVAYFEEGAPLPSRAVIVTFDDGYRDTYEVAAPILRRHGFTATVFLVSDRIGDRTSWVEDPRYVYPLMDLDQIRELRSQGFAFGSHTCTHPCLVRIPKEQAWEEIRRSKRDLENLLQEEIRVFCYPYGDYNETVVRMVRDAGYRAARVVHTDNRHRREDLLTLRCVKVNGFVHILKFAYYLTEWYHRETLRHLRRKEARS